MILLRRSLVLSAASLVLLPTASRAADTVSGKFIGNGKPVTLAFVSAWLADGMSGKQAVAVVMTEKDHSASRRPAFDAGFHKFGSALTIRLHRDNGQIFGCEIAHQGLKRSPFSSIGPIKIEGMNLDSNRIKARFFTTKPDTFFDDTYEVDVKVDAAIGPKLA